MPSVLSILRQMPQITPTKFLAAQPGCWIQYYDDTTAKDPVKALSARSFTVAVARRKQQQRCAVCFSLQAFGEARTKEGLISFRNLGVDVDLLTAAERRTLAPEEIDRRKDDYLTRHLLPFPIRPQWLTETRHGFHIIFRVLPRQDEESIRESMEINRRLVSMLHGDENAALLTQVLRVPGTLQFKNPEHPFLCRLLLDNASKVPPYDLAAIRSVLDARDVFHASESKKESARPTQDMSNGNQSASRQSELDGVSEGRRNAAAAAIIGGILGRLPEYLWEISGWGGLILWNKRNTVPLPERELRSVFESIARRERAGRQREGRKLDGEEGKSILIRVDIRIGEDVTGQSFKAEARNISPSGVRSEQTPSSSDAKPIEDHSPKIVSSESPNVP